MKQKHSIRTRIYLLFASFTLFTCLSYSVLLLGYSWVVEDNVFNRLVEDEARHIENHFQETGELTQPRAPFLTLYEDWEALPEDIYSTHIKDPQRVEFTTQDGSTLHLRPLQLGNHTQVLVADVSAFEVGSDYLPYVSLSLVLVLILFSSLAIAFAWPVASAASKPLLDLKEKVETIDLDTLKPGFAKPFPDNEIGYLAYEIERSMLRIQAMLKRESDFTRDVSHELRTPTTILKNIAAQARADAPMPAKQVAQLKAAVQDMEQTIDTLLALARDESQALESLVFLHVLEECIIRHPELARQDAFSLELNIPPTLRVTANHNLLTLLINNLLSNALAHASRPCLHIEAVENGIVFRNPTDSPLDSDPLADRSKSHASDGLGLGLYLVQRICGVIGWSVSTHFDAGDFVLLLNHTEA